jgi:hypothetical protein
MPGSELKDEQGHNPATSRYYWHSQHCTPGWQGQVAAAHRAISIWQRIDRSAKQPVEPQESWIASSIPTQLSSSGLPPSLKLRRAREIAGPVEALA